MGDIRPLGVSVFVQMIRALPERERMIFCLIAFIGGTAEEVSDHLAQRGYRVSPAQVEVIYQQASERVGLL